MATGTEPPPTPAPRRRAAPPARRADGIELIGETISWERWEGTLEYTMMAPIHRYTQLIGTTFYALLYGLVQTGVVLFVVVLFYGLESIVPTNSNAATHGDLMPTAGSGVAILTPFGTNPCDVGNVDRSKCWFLSGT